MHTLEYVAMATVMIVIVLASEALGIDISDG